MQVFRFDKPANFTKPVLSSSKDGKASPLRLATNASKQGTRLSFEYADGTPYHVRVYDPQGKMVLEKEHQTQSQINLNTAGLPASTYLVSL